MLIVFMYRCCGGAKAEVEEEEGKEGESEEKKNLHLSLNLSSPFPPLLLFPPPTLPSPSYSSRTIAFFSRLATVSLGCAPTASHFLMAGALRLVSFFRGS